MSLANVITESYKQILENEGVEVLNKTTKQAFYGLVSSGEVEAVFTLIDQDISDSLQITTLKENRPKTGDKMTVGNRDYTVKQVTERTNSPLIRIFVQR